MSETPRKQTDINQTSSISLASSSPSQSEKKTALTSQLTPEIIAPKQSKRAYFWAQTSNRDMFTQATARNMVAISKQKANPQKKPGPGPLITPNETVGLEMVATRESVIKGYAKSQQLIQGRIQDRTDIARMQANNLSSHDDLRSKAKKKHWPSMDDNRSDLSDSLEDSIDEIASLKSDLTLTMQKHTAAQQTVITWPGHESWEQTKDSMANEPSKLVTLGHGAPRLTGISTTMHPDPSTMHQFGDIVDSQMNTGLPLDHVAKRLGACHASASPLKESLQKGAQEADRSGNLPEDLRTDLLKNSASTQQFSQAYHDRGIEQPNVKGASLAMARYPDQTRRVQFNEVELSGGGREPSKGHKVTHQPLFEARKPN